VRDGDPDKDKDDNDWGDCNYCARLSAVVSMARAAMISASLTRSKCSGPSSPTLAGPGRTHGMRAFKLPDSKPQTRASVAFREPRIVSTSCARCSAYA